MDNDIEEEIPIIDLTEDEGTPTISTSKSTSGGNALSMKPISVEEARVLGCLIEKEATTPDYYPLTLNSLVTACNQSTNRDPVVNYDDGTVDAALDGLKARQFVFQVTLAGARVQKYKHNFLGKFPDLERPQVAVLCVLLLRGPQTLGELRQRTERLYAFPDLPSLESSVEALANHRDGPLVVTFPPGPGRKATLYVHTLCGVPEAPGLDASPKAVILNTGPTLTSQQEQWKARVEEELAALREEVQKLKTALGVD